MRCMRDIFEEFWFVLWIPIMCLAWAVVDKINAPSEKQKLIEMCSKLQAEAQIECFKKIP